MGYFAVMCEWIVDCQAGFGSASIDNIHWKGRRFEDNEQQPDPGRSPFHIG